MFGQRIDYQLLRLLTHRRRRATRCELIAQAQTSNFQLADAADYLGYVGGELFRGDFDVDPDLSYLDVGCGMGRLSLALAAAGAKDVTGLDIIDRNVTAADRLARKLLPAAAQPTFIHCDVHDYRADRLYDVIVALGALEHIHDQAGFLAALPGLLKPGGRCYVSIEPFHSPLGDHMQHFFHVPVPWTGLLFNESAVLQRRREVFRPDDPATRYKDIEGGLNQVRYGDYLENIKNAGLVIETHHANPQLARRLIALPAYVASAVLTRIPVLRDFFIVTDYAILRHAPTPGLRPLRPYR